MAAPNNQAELISGLASALFVLVQTMHNEGVMPAQKYRDALLRLWDRMPEQGAQAGEGVLFERLIDLLNEIPPQQTP